MVTYLIKHPAELWLKLLEAAFGVQYLHARGVVHGDLKGNNIVIGGDLKAKVTDFGLSFVANQDTEALVSGACHWVAPECLRDDLERPRFASDVYSLGMCIVEALRVVEAVKSGSNPYGCLPWIAADLAAVRYHATRGNLPPRPFCEDSQWELVTQMCVLEPTKRLTIAEVVDKLTRLASGQPNDLTVISPTGSFELRSVPQVAATAQGILARLQLESTRDEVASVLLLYVCLWNRLEQIHGQISIKNGEDFRAEFGSIVAEVDSVTSKLQESTTSRLALAELALRCYAFERRLDKLGDGDTDVTWAAKNGRIEVVRELIENGADVNAQDDKGTTALMAAAEYDQLEMVKFLIEHGASLTTTDDDGDTALMIAAVKGPIKVCRYLAEQPGTDVNATNKLGCTALMAAALSGHLKVVQYLASQHGCDANVADTHGFTALTFATLLGAADVVRYLVEDCGAVIDSKTEYGETVLMMAASAGHLDLCQYFAELYGADVNAKDVFGDTALIKAASSGHSKIVRCLVDNYDADVNYKNDKGNTALMRATRNGHVEVVRCLVEQRGIDVTARNQRGETAISLAVEHGYQEIRRMLTSFLPPRPQQNVDGDLSSSQASMSSIPASEVEFVRFCENGNIGGEYRAKWLDADAVVKLFVADASTTTFEEEIRLWQQLRHPNVMKMYGACYAPPNLQFFVCEYISDGSLIEHVELASAMRPTVWKFLHEAALGLTYLHERGILHGDLRCSNILLGSDGLAKLSNFGLSGSVKRSDRDSSGVVGSKRWLACEILQGEQPSIASDVYSLGMCILESTTREKPWSCEIEQVVEKYKKRWTPETDAYSFSEPDCASGDARKLVWRMCSNDAARRVTLAPVVDELERLAIAESSNSSQPELEPPNLSESSKLKELWLEVQTHMDTCGDDQYHRAFNDLKRIREGLESSADNNSPVLLERFHTLLTDFYRIITMSPEQASIMRLWSTRSTTASMNAIHLCIESLLTLLDDSADSTNVKQDRWQQQRSEQIELFVSGVEDTSFLLERLKTAEERAVFLKTLKAEMDDPQSQYTPAQFEVVEKAHKAIARTIESEDLSKLIPEWFIPRFELFIDGWRCLGSGGFGCVYRAKWLGSDVVAKLLGSEGHADLFAPNAQSSQSNFSALLDLSSTRSLMDSTKRGEAIAMFRHEVDIWFGFNHPHVVRLFGACHVGTPFFACEYATNGTLVKYLETHPGELWAKLHEAALGVQYLHARKVVHGDLKGNNIVVGSDMKAKVTDFGLSSIAGNDAKPQVSGAWHWVAPECLPDGIPNAAVKSPTFESDIYSLGMCIVEAMRVVENVERVKSGKKPQRYLPWGGLDNFLVRFHATKGTLPSTPSVCSDDQWELVKQMCAFKPTSRVKISTVVDRLAHLAKRRETSDKAASDPKYVPEVVAAARELLGRLRGEERQASVVQLYTLLWDRLEQTSENVNDKLGEEGQNAFYSLVAEANKATSELQGASHSLISSAER
ncbi:hypothetical protein PF010_g27611, partial [Phytophthora fragariae]